jgi:glycine dehydrogenase
MRSSTAPRASAPSPSASTSTPSASPAHFAPPAPASRPDHFFDTITVEVGVGQAGILASARAEGLNFRRIGHDRIGISLDETTDEKVLLRVLRAFGIDAAPPHRGDIAIPESLVRTSDYLTHPVFHMNRAESEMMRYMRRLSDRDLALDRAMIPLGSCTMKLKAAAEMMPITWPEFGQLPPLRAARPGARLCPKADRGPEPQALRDHRLTRHSRCSPTPARRAEYAGLLRSKAYHRANGRPRPQRSA